MIRRPPTIIALGEEDLQAHLHRMFLRTLPENLDRLHLDDPDQNRPRDASSSEDPYDLSDQSDGDRAFNASHRPRGGPSCVGHASLADAGSSLPASINGSTHRTIDPNRAPAATQLISSTRARASQRRDRSFMPWQRLTIPPHEVLSHRIRPPQYGKKENSQRNHPQDVWTRMNDESRLSLPNTARLSPAAIPKMPIDTVPLRDLALAPTESYEAVSAGHKSAPPIAESPWEFGAVQPDLIFRACTDIVLEPPMAGPGVLQP